MTPVLPSMTGPSQKRSTLGWLASTSVAALLVTGVAALAMSYQPAGSSMGDEAQALLVMLPPTPAVEAMAEPTPEVASDEPEVQPDQPQVEETPDTPELVEDLPEIPEVMEPEEVMAEDAPIIDKEPPPTPMAEVPSMRPKAKPRREKPVEKKEPPKKVAEKKEEKKDPPKKKKAAAPAAASSAAAAPSEAKSGGASVGGGKASAASYGAQVMKKIAKTKKKRAGEKGTAVVAFSITGSGGLASASIARSSGSAKVDQIALDHVRRAAPFAPPPPGAKTSFTVKVDAK